MTDTRCPQCGEEIARYDCIVIPHGPSLCRHPKVFDDTSEEPKDGPEQALVLPFVFGLIAGTFLLMAMTVAAFGVLVIACQWVKSLLFG
jgi:hypothetical protein